MCKSRADQVIASLGFGLELHGSIRVFSAMDVERCEEVE